MPKITKRTYSNGSKLYTCWSNMKSRCMNKSSVMYKYYGGRGITVDASWLEYDNFEKDMLASFQEAMFKNTPDNKRKRINVSLDRIDNGKGYNKENCRWATQKDQCNNRRVPDCWGKLVGGERKSYARICREKNINYSAFTWRIRNGYSAEDAISKPYLSRNKMAKFDRKKYQQGYYLRVVLPKRKEKRQLFK